MESPGHLAAANEARARHAWLEAIGHYEQADDGHTLSASDLWEYGVAAWLSGRVKNSIKLLDRAYRAALAEDDFDEAIRFALQLVRFHNDRTQRATARAWLKRAERLAEQAPDTVGAGQVLYMNAFKADAAGRVDDALDYCEQALTIGRRHGDPDLVALALNRKGRVLIKTGRIEEGNALLDEAMLGVVGDEVSLVVSGIIYCSTIDGCTDATDYRRAGEWTEATDAWCAQNGVRGFPGVCRVHRAELLRLRGDWDDAHTEAERAFEELTTYGMAPVACDATAELGLVYLRRGDLEAAERAFSQAEELGGTPEPGLSLLRVAQGRPDRASLGIKRALAERATPLSRFRLLPAAVEAAIAANDLEAAESALEELREIALHYNTDTLCAQARTAKGRVLIAKNDAAGATTCLREALRLFNELDMPYEAARARTLVATAYAAEGDEEGARTELMRARKTFERLGARLDLDQVDRRLEGPSEPLGNHRDRVFMFTDIVQSTKLAEVLGDQAWTRVLRWHDDTLRGALTNHHGEVVKHTGDGFLATFADADDAIRCAIAIQKRLAEHRADAGFAVQVRIGLHRAEAIRLERDYAGKGVHEAARIMGLAGADEIFASWDTALEAQADLQLTGPRDAQLKGIAEPVQVCTIEWR